MNFTPLTDDKIQELATGVKKPTTPVTISVHPESGPITIEPGKPEQDVAPETTKNEEQKEEPATKELSNHPQTYIEERPEEIELPDELKKHGLQAVKQNDFPDYRNVKLPISDEKVMMGSKAPINTSMRWLAEFAKFLLWKAHITLKTIHGRVVRVVKK